MANLKHIMNTYSQEQLSFVKGQGVYLWDQNDNKYLDTSAGIAVMSLGHSHSEVIEVIQNQSAKLMHVTNSTIITSQVELSKNLCEASGMDNVFFCNSGGEAMEASLKLARLYGHKLNYKNPKLIVLSGGFHGRTFATISATNSQINQDLFSPLLPGFVHCEYDNPMALSDLLINTDEVVGVLLEPIQGEGGIQIPKDGFLKEVRKLCDIHKVLMILDEVQTGFGRTGGKLYAFQHENILPDILASAKGLGNGFPIGACLARGEAATLFTPGSHGSTFGGNPLACAVGVKVLELMLKDDLLSQAAKMGEYLLNTLQLKLNKYSCITDIRGKGLMIGVELNQECVSLRKKALDIGLVLNITKKCILRLTPPLIITKNECDEVVEKLNILISNFVTKS
ncbi:MAG: acetylornithine/N-succinyldiaminopimelate aminotransferase [Francisellaceae bacterium]|jgi:acetylornithine/N-succinyldiaminopimelate aminotransferase